MGVMVKVELCEEVGDVIKVSDRVLLLFFKKGLLRLICGYAPQSGRPLEERQSFVMAKCECDMHSAGILAMCLEDFDGHIGRHIDGFDGSHGEYGVGLMNL